MGDPIDGPTPSHPTSAHYLASVTVAWPGFPAHGHKAVMDYVSCIYRIRAVGIQASPTPAFHALSAGPWCPYRPYTLSAACLLFRSDVSSPQSAVVTTVALRDHVSQKVLGSDLVSHMTQRQAVVIHAPTALQLQRGTMIYIPSTFLATGRGPHNCTGFIQRPPSCISHPVKCFSPVAKNNLEWDSVMRASRRTTPLPRLLLQEDTGSATRWIW
ncbi:hypothetical protein EDC04DRAFT_560434 [Pisolithus marmoratus]|nr:hypothetical protein EDC04DRAFT_560434 [Pisolithus marmoratus]